MSFRKVGGLKRNSRNNIVTNNYINSTKTITKTIGGENNDYSKVIYNSDICGNINIDIGRNITTHGTATIYQDISGFSNLDISGNTTTHGTATIYQDINGFSNLDISGNINGFSNLDITGNASFDKCNTNSINDIDDNWYVDTNGNAKFNDISYNVIQISQTSLTALDISDNIIGINNGDINSKDSGIILYRYSTTDDDISLNIFFGFNEIDKTFRIAYTDQSSVLIDNFNSTDLDNQLCDLKVNKITVNQLKTTSDYRIKTNITSLGSFHTVDDLNPVIYQKNGSREKEIGLLAHEVQSVYPDLVTGEKDGDNLQTLDYTGLIGILINEVKMLKKDIGILKNDNKILKEKLL